MFCALGLIRGPWSFSPANLNRQFSGNTALKRFSLLVDTSSPSAPVLPSRNLNATPADIVTPYELYLKFLYEYFREDLETPNTDHIRIADSAHHLDYQIQAVRTARRILHTHNGVFLSDVVGLGKTYIAAMLLQTLPGPKLIICSPVLMDYWEAALRKFFVTKYKIISSGSLPTAKPATFAACKCVVVDESHNFRNENTATYATLREICLGKKVILLSATPFNNYITDIRGQLKLFQPGKNSTIPGVPDLNKFFHYLQRRLKALSPMGEECKQEAEWLAAQVRDKILKHVLIRRTRTEVMKYFSADMERSGLTFPIVQPPKALVYEFDATLENIFNETIALLRQLTFARYTAQLYLKKATRRQLSGQKNLVGFMKSVLVKRLESSFYAFSATISRFVKSHQNFIGRLDAGRVYVGTRFHGNALADMDVAGPQAGRAMPGAISFSSEDFNRALAADARADLGILQTIEALWQNVKTDPKFAAFRSHLLNDLLPKGKQGLVFTESTETSRYIYGCLEQEMPGKALAYNSACGLYLGKRISAREARAKIARNFDPSSAERSKDIYPHHYGCVGRRDKSPSRWLHNQL